MGKHILGLNVGCTANEGVLLLEDISFYDSSLPVSCCELQILSPGFVVPVVLEVSANFHLTLNACWLGILSSVNCSDGCPKLDDGIYHLRYSVSPSSLVFVEYNYLRTTRAINRLNELLCKLPLQCALPGEELLTDLTNINLIHEYLIAAKTFVEEQNKPADGINMYRYAVSLIDKMDKCKPNY